MRQIMKKVRGERNKGITKDAERGGWIGRQ